MAVFDSTGQGEMFPVIEHSISNVPDVIGQRAVDGYINATSLCQAAGKALSHYLSLKSTNDFLDELSRSLGIPRDLLVHKITAGPNNKRGTWVHPQIAINIGQWASPQFAVLVSQWVFDWMNGGANFVPDHIKRYLVNRSKIPLTHFSMLDQMTLRLLAPLEEKGYLISNGMMPDISLGRMFSSWLRRQGYDPDSFPTYQHEFIDGRAPVPARLYPNELMTAFNLELQTWLTNGKAVKYFGDRDAASILPLNQVIQALPAIEN